MPDPSPVKGRVIVVGILFWYPLAGVTYQCLHYLLGLKQLGYDVWYVEDMQGDVYDPIAGDYTYDASENLRLLGPQLNAHGFEGRWAFRDCTVATFGMTDAALNDLYKAADVCLNVCASHELRGDQMVIPNRLYVESDPFSAQVKYVEDREGARQFLDAHTAFFTFGENIGKPHCGIPVTGHNGSQPVIRSTCRFGQTAPPLAGRPTPPSPPGTTRATRFTTTASRSTGPKTASSSNIWTCSNTGPM